MADASKGNSGQRRKPGPKKPHRANFTSGKNSQSGKTFQRGPDVLPRRPVVSAVQLQALAQEQLRDPRTGRLSRSKWAKGVRAAGLKDFLRGHVRALYVLAHGDPQEAATLASALTRLGDYFAVHLDDKAPSQGRTTTFVFSTAPPDQTIPPDQGRRRLVGTVPVPPAPGEDEYVEVGEEDAL